MAMMPSNPPTFQEATRPCWWALVVESGFIDSRDFPALALANRAWSRLVMPLIWSNPFQTAKRAGLDLDDEKTWWLKFIFNTLELARPQTRALTHLLDLRGFARDPYGFTLESHGKSIRKRFKRVAELLPNLSCVLVDGYADEELQNILSHFSDPGSGDGLHLLSLAHYALPVPDFFWASPALQELVYLDISSVPGSIWPMIRPNTLPKLGILKIRHREIDDETFKSLTTSFKDRLWSLDVTSNKLTDSIVDHLAHNSPGEDENKSEDHFHVEGRQGRPDYHGSPAGGPNLIQIEESEWSGSFSHPDRYLADAPVYQIDHGHPLKTRQDGVSKIKQDTEAATIRELSRPDFREWSSHLGGVRRITHLDVSDNQISSFGIEMMLTMSRGHLEYFACNSTPLIAPPKTYARIWPKTSKLYGILGAAYALRPVISANLRALSVHHSVVTQVPALEISGRSTLARWYLAETSILSRSEKAYPQAYVPDMNPRLTSLTLSGIPRRSTGPLITKITNFLTMLSIQERAILDVTRIVPLRRGPAILKGLRHLRLEFEPDPVEPGTWTVDDLDAEELMNTGDEGFSFFNDETGGPSRVTTSSQVRFETRSNSNGVSHIANTMESDRELGDWVYHQTSCRGAGPGIFNLEVWIGTKNHNPNPIINDYRRLVLDHNLREGVGPVSPAQVLAGAPKGAYIFHTAWCATIMPRELEVPASSDLEGMKDVFAEIKQFRAEGRALDQAVRQVQDQVPEGSSPPYWHGDLSVCFHQRPPEESWR